MYLIWMIIFYAPLNRHGRNYIDGCGPGLALQLLALVTVLQTVQRTTTDGCCTSHQNLFLQLCFTACTRHFAYFTHWCHCAIFKNRAYSICHHGFPHYSFHILPPLLLIFYPCKIFNRSLNCCSERRQHLLCTFWKPFKDATKLGDGISDQCLESIIYIIMLLHFPCWSQS